MLLTFCNWESHLTDSRLLQINFVILVVSVVGGMKENARPSLLRASCVSSAAKRTILLGNAQCVILLEVKVTGRLRYKYI